MITTAKNGAVIMSDTDEFRTAQAALCRLARQIEPVHGPRGENDIIVTAGTVTDYPRFSVRIEITFNRPELASVGAPEPEPVEPAATAEPANVAAEAVRELVTTGTRWPEISAAIDKAPAEAFGAIYETLAGSVYWERFYREYC